nr:FAD-linked oxidase C-terminal domain-containing protein [Desulfosporosinus orientis]
MFTQDFGRSEDLPRYEGLMKDVSDLVVKRFGGSLKAEHGIGRNMAPFVACSSVKMNLKEKFYKVAQACDEQSPF